MERTVTGSTVVCTSIADFVSTAVQPSANGVIGTINKGETGYVEYQLTDDCFMSGFRILVKNGLITDTMGVQIRAANDTLLLVAVCNWNPVEDKQDQGFFTTHEVQKILAGMKIRVTYNSTATILGSNVTLAANFLLHKALY